MVPCPVTQLMTNIILIFVVVSEPTYTWDFNEMVNFMTDIIEDAITSDSFYDIVLEEIVSIPGYNKMTISEQNRLDDTPH